MFKVWLSRIGLGVSKLGMIVACQGAGGWGQLRWTIYIYIHIHGVGYPGNPKTCVLHLSHMVCNTWLMTLR